MHRYKHVASDFGSFIICRGYFDFFTVRLNFISPNEHQMQYFHEWRKSPVEIQVLGFMSEIKFDLALNEKGYNMSKHVIMGGS